jgi:hypothetical protein
LPLAITRKRLKAVAWRRPQVAKVAGGVEVAQFPARHLDQVGRKAFRAFTVRVRPVVIAMAVIGAEDAGSRCDDLGRRALSRPEAMRRSSFTSRARTRSMALMRWARPLRTAGNRFV